MVEIYEQQIAENERLKATVDADDKSEYIEPRKLDNRSARLEMLQPKQTMPMIK